jgi:endonuclease III
MIGDIKTVRQLYERVLPALVTKVNEWKKQNITNIKEEDLFEYLKQTKWKNSKDLLLYQMIDDILNCQKEDYDNFINKMKK